MRHFLFAVTLLLAPAAATTDVWNVVDRLGEAYAKDAEVAWGGETHAAGTKVTNANLTKERAAVISAIRVGYAPKGKPFRTVPWNDLKAVMSVSNAKGGPEDAATAAVSPGATVSPVTWTFGGTAVEGYVILNTSGKLSYDTLVSMPVIRAPIFDTPLR